MSRCRCAFGAERLASLVLAVCVSGCETTVVHRRPVPPPSPRVVTVEPVEYVPYVPLHSRVNVHPVREFHKDPRVDYRKPPKPPKPMSKKVAPPKKKVAPPKKVAPKPPKTAPAPNAKR